MGRDPDPIELGGHQPINLIKVGGHAIPDLEHRRPFHVSELARPTHYFNLINSLFYLEKKPNYDAYIVLAVLMMSTALDAPRTSRHSRETGDCIQ